MSKSFDPKGHGPRQLPKVTYKNSSKARSANPNIQAPPTDRTRPSPDAAIDVTDSSTYSVKVDKNDETIFPFVLSRKQLLPGLSPLRDEKAAALERHKANAESLREEMRNPVRKVDDSLPSIADQWREYL